MRAVQFVSIAGAVFATSQTAAQQQTTTWGTVGGWEIRVDRTVGDGCYAYQRYEDGSNVRMGFDARYGTIYLILGNSAWRSLELGKKYRLHFAFDEASNYQGDFEGRRFGDYIVLEGYGLSYEFANDFMQRNRVRIYYHGAQITHLSLAKTAAAIGEVVKCQQAMGGLKGGAREGDPFRSTSNQPDPFAR